MTEAGKIQMVSAMSGETNDAVISAYLRLAGSKICQLACPFQSDVEDVPPKYEMVQVEAAVYLLNKRGAEGETSHSENGISRSYENGDLPESMLRQITPMAGVAR